MSNSVEILEKKVNELQNKSYNLESKLELILNKKAYELLNNHISEDITLRTTRDSVYFHALREDKNYSREIFRLNINRDWKTGKVNDIKPSAYSTSENSDFELKRLITIGNVAKFLLEGGKEEMLGWWNNLTESWNDEINKVNKERYEIEDEIKIINRAKEDKIKQNRLSLLKTKGLKFDYSELEHRYNIPVLDLKYNNYINNVVELQVTRESGKSVDIRVITLSQRYDEKTKTYVYINDQPRIYQRVKLVHIESFINSAKKYIVQ